MLDPSHPELQVGALVWVQIGGQLIFPKPVAIKKIHEREGKKWFIVEGSPTGLTVDNLTLAATGADAPAPDAPMVEFALHYARRGWPVFPCKPTNKSPYIKGGLNAATTNQEMIRRWWQRWPHAMIGVTMGARSGVWAVDPDPPKKPGDPDGRVVWAGLLREHGKLPATHAEITPRGGQHVLFKWDPDRPVTNSPGALAKTNIDVRGEGGYIVVAPSVCVGDGSKNVAGRYSVAGNFFHFAEAPDWLYELVLARPEPEPKPAPEPVQATTSSSPRSSEKSDDGKQFWRKVNDTAFHNLRAWVPEIFGSAAEYQPNTGAWRISSKALGRELEEDLSIHPDGVTDFGVWDIGDARQGKRTAIDIVIEYGRKRDAAEAALWLCERCGVEPATLGWATGERRSFNSAGYDFNKAGPQGGRWSAGDDGSAGSKTGRDKSNPGTSQTSQQASSAGIKLDYYENFGKAAAKKSIIKGVIFKGERSSWIGPPGCGKSALLANIAIHSADGHDWRGYRSKDRVGVVYFALERSQLTKRRLMGHALQSEGSPNLPIAVAAGVINLLNSGCVPTIIDTVRTAEAHFGCPVGLIIIDTFNKGIAVGGGDESSAKDQNITAANLQRVQDQIDVHVALIGHTGKDESRGARGSNAHLGDVDMMVQISVDGDVRTATITMINDGVEGVLTRFKLKTVTMGQDEDGDDITTAIVSDDRLDTEKEISRARLNKSQRRAMDLLVRCIGDEGEPAPNDIEYPQRVRVVPLERWRITCQKGALSPAGTKESAEKAFQRAQRDLVAMHRIGIWDGRVWIAYD